MRQENERLRAQLRRREQQLFGRQTETHAATSPAAPPARPNPEPPWPRGQQRGQPGPRRRDHAHLPAVVEDREIPGDSCRCQRCGRPFAPVSGTEDSTLLEVEVRARRGVVRRHRYRPTCACGVHPGVITAPPAPRAIPTSTSGVSIRVTVLLDKYLS